MTPEKQPLSDKTLDHFLANRPHPVIPKGLSQRIIQAGLATQQTATHKSETPFLSEAAFIWRACFHGYSAKLILLTFIIGFMVGGFLPSSHIKVPTHQNSALQIYFSQAYHYGYTP